MTAAQQAPERSQGVPLGHFCVWGRGKVESVLAHFYRRHPEVRIGPGYQALPYGLPGMEPETLPFAVQSADWFHPTLEFSRAAAIVTNGGLWPPMQR